MELRTALAELEHVGELCRLASVFSGKQREQLTEREYGALMAQTAGQTFRYPRPTPTLRVAEQLGLVHRKARALRLSDLGHHFKDLGVNDRAAPSFDQGRLLLSLFLDDESLRELITVVFRALQRDDSGRLKVSENASAENCGTSDVVRLLQQCQILEYIEGELFLLAGADTFLPVEIFQPDGMTEAELLERLEEQRIRGLAAEQYVVLLEQERLRREGRADLAPYVLRISSDDVAAGYDVRSFETDGTVRYIEVKSSIGSRLRFEWSTRERKCAAERSLSYWIYFVPLAGNITVRPLPVVTISDPHRYIADGHLKELPTAYLVTGAKHVRMSRLSEEPLHNIDRYI